MEQEKVDANKAALLRDIMKLRPRPTRLRTARYLEDERDSFLDYEKFLEVYWAHFPENALSMYYAKLMLARGLLTFLNRSGSGVGGIHG